MTSIPHETPREPNPLHALSLDWLRCRTSMKWRTHPADVLPLWVAEMDVPLAEPVVRVVTPRPVRPTAQETAQNPRAASARLRVAEKTS